MSNNSMRFDTPEQLKGYIEELKEKAANSIGIKALDKVKNLVAQLKNESAAASASFTASSANFEKRKEEFEQKMKEQAANLKEREEETLITKENAEAARVKLAEQAKKLDQLQQNGAASAASKLQIEKDMEQLQKNMVEALQAEEEEKKALKNENVILTTNISELENNRQELEEGYKKQMDELNTKWGMTVQESLKKIMASLNEVSADSLTAEELNKLGQEQVGGFQSSSSGITDFKKYRSSSRSYSSRIKNLRKKRKESKKKRKDKKKSETKKIYIHDKKRRR